MIITIMGIVFTKFSVDAKKAWPQSMGIISPNKYWERTLRLE